MGISQLKNNNLFKYFVILATLFIVLSIILFNQASFWFLGIGIAILGFIILYEINNKKNK